MTDPTPTPAPVDLAELRRLLDAATPGPWKLHPNGVILGLPRSREALAAWVVELVDLIRPEDGALIAALRNAAPWLLDRAAAAVVWRLLAERALDLAMYGEGAPGMTDTWQKLEAGMRERAALDGSGVAE